MHALKVLVVDDSSRMRSSLTQSFHDLGHEVVAEAQNGVEALELINELHPDLVTMDIIMPEMDGIECYRLLRSLSYPPRCILISALAQETRVIYAYREEIDPNHFLVKGASIEDLKNKIEAVFNQTPLPLPVVEDGGEA